jgi:hypothetical protein
MDPFLKVPKTPGTFFWNFFKSEGTIYEKCFPNWTSLQNWASMKCSEKKFFNFVKFIPQFRCFTHCEVN